MENGNWYESPIIWIPLALGLIGLIIWIARKKKASKGTPLPPDGVLFCPPPEMQEKMKAWGGTFPHFYSTPNGSQVYSGVEVPKEALETLDRAVAFSIRVQQAQFPEWTKMLHPKEYEFWFVEADGIAPQAQIPFITRGGHPTAGTVSFCDSTRKQRTAVYLPDYRLVNWEKEEGLYWSAFNELEHAREIQNDVTLAKTFFGAGDVHPHQHQGKPSPYDLMPKTLLAKRIPNLPCHFGLK